MLPADPWPLLFPVFSPVVAAICIANTIVDTSPFSTNGALIVGNASEEDRPAILRKLLVYAAIVVGVGPLLAWAAFVGLPGL